LFNPKKEEIMAKLLGFLIWTDDPTVAPPGEQGKFSDGITVSLFETVKKYLAETGKDISSVPLKLELLKNGQVVAEHSFNMDSVSTIWLVADPAASDKNGSFTPAFLSVFVNEPAGVHEYTVKLYLDNQLYEEGSIVYESDGDSIAFKELLTKFDNVDAVRVQANAQHQSEYSEQLAKEEEAQRAVREFDIYIENTDVTHTKYLVCKDHNVYSETVYEILPGQTLTLSLFRGTEYDLKYYDQDWAPGERLPIAVVDESHEEAKYQIN